jgi:hypothetical protein
MLKKRRWWLLGLLALVPLSSANAGTSGGIREGRAEGHDVHIDSATKTAWGALGTVRLEPLPDPVVDTYQPKSIGCYVDAGAPAGSGSPSGPKGSALIRCEAITTNNWLACVSGDAAFVSAIGAMNGDSRITFSVGPDGVTCVHLVVDNSSIYQQKAN